MNPNSLSPFSVLFAVWSLSRGSVKNSFSSSEKHLHIHCRDVISYFDQNLPRIPHFSAQIHNMNTFHKWTKFDLDSDDDLPEEYLYADFIYSMVIRVGFNQLTSRFNVFEISAH